MDVLVGVRQIPPTFADAPGHVARHVTSRQITRQTAHGSTTITETFMEVIMDTWTEVDPSQPTVPARQLASQTAHVDPSEALWTEATDPLSGEVSQRVQHSSAQFQDFRYQNVISQRATRHVDDEMSITEMEMLTGVETPQYRGQYRSVPAVPEFRTMPGYSSSSSMYRSLPSSDSSANIDSRRRHQSVAFQNESRSSQVTTRSYQAADPNLHIAMGAFSRDDRSRYQNQMPPYQPTRTTIQSYKSNQSDQYTQVPLEPLLGSDSTQHRDQNRFLHQQFRPPDQIDLTGSMSEELPMLDPTIGDHTHRSTGRYQFTGTTQCSRPPPSHFFPSTQPNPTNISTDVDSQCQDQCYISRPTRSRTVRQEMPYSSTFERNTSTKAPSQNQSNYPCTSHLTQNLTAQVNPPETSWSTTFKVEPHKQEYQYASSLINPQMVPSGQFNPTVFRSMPASMASFAEGIPHTQGQHIPESSTNRTQPSQPTFSDPSDPFSFAEMDIFTGVETSRYQGQFISAPLLTEHQTQESNLPDPLTYPFLGGPVDTPETKFTSQGDANSSPQFSESNLIKIEPRHQSTLDSSLVIDLEDSNIDMPSYQNYNIPTPSLPEALPQALQGDLPNVNAYPSLAAAIDALAEMEITGQQNRYESGHSTSQTSMPPTNTFRAGTPQAHNQSQIFESSQFNRVSASSSIGVHQLQRQSPNRGIPSAPSQTPPESERQRVARLLREFLKKS